MVQLLRMVCSCCFANEMRWVLIGTNLVQSCRSCRSMYFGLFRITLKAMFCTNWSFSIWHSAALIEQILEYSKIGMINDWYSLASMLGLGSLAKEDIL